MIISKRIQNANRRFAAAKIIKNIDMENDILDAKETEVTDSPQPVLSPYFGRIGFGAEREGAFFRDNTG